ncbi:MAG: Gfo/Idh/MocA family oxidoreductase [Chloroflexota bacterium]
MANKLQVGIVGCGAVAAKRHIPGFLRLRNKVVFQAVCDRNEALARETAKRFAIPWAYPSLSEMLAQEKLDIVDICTPPQTHAAVAIEALEKGCHILLEKPMALTTADCDGMLSASQKHGKKLCIVHNVLFHPPLLKARKLVREGAIGEFTGMRILLSDPRAEMIMRKDYWIHKLPGGLIGETGPHPVYISLAFIGRVNSVEVYARRFLEHPWAPFDEFRIELDGERGMSSVVVSYSSNRYEAGVDILGTEGALRLDLQGMLTIRQGAKTSLSPLSVVSSSLGSVSQTVEGLLGNSFKVATGRFRLGHDTVIEMFVDSVLEDNPPPVTGEEGREVVRVMEMIVARLRQKYGLAQPTP